ncbi:MAG: metal-dependent hydrolase [Candidatus Acidiferrales bacterium]
MEPITHALASFAAARATQRRLPRFGAAMFVAAGVAPDLDLAGYFGGASAYLRFHRAALHGVLGGAALACAVATAFCWADRKYPAKNRAVGKLRFAAAVAVCFAGVGLHVALDLLSGVGVNLLWPLRTHWYGVPLETNLDPWLLIILIAGILLPELFRLVGDEIGERKKTPRGRVAAIVTLVLVAFCFGVRAELHAQAHALLMSREYHGRAPVDVQAYPKSATPFDWRGVVATEETLEEIEVDVGPGDDFDPERSETHFKPADSPALDLGEQTEAAKIFLAYAQFPLASVVQSDDGYRLTLRDLRFAKDDASPDNIIVKAEFDPALRLQAEALAFPSPHGR